MSTRGNTIHNTTQHSTHLHGLAVKRVGDVLLDPGAERDHVGLRVLGLGVAGGDPDLALLADADHAQDLGVSDRGDAVIIKVYRQQIVEKGPCQKNSYCRPQERHPVRRIDYA